MCSKKLVPEELHVPVVPATGERERLESVDCLEWGARDQIGQQGCKNKPLNTEIYI